MAFPILILPRPAVAAGVVAACLLALIHHGIVTGLLVVPILPIAAMAWAGFRHGISGLSTATLTALALGSLLLGPFDMVLVLALQLFPAWLFLREFFKLQVYPGGLAHWAPPGAAFLAVSLYASVFLLLISLLSPTEFDRILATLAQSWETAMRQLDPKTAATLGGDAAMAHLAMAFGVWVAGGMFYAAACLGNLVVLGFQRSLRPSLALQPFTPPLWLFGMFVAAGVVSLLEAGRWSVIAQMLSLILLLPYFISGLSQLHSALRRWQHGVIWQSGFYVLLVLTLWPALFIAAYGLARHCLGLLSPAASPR